MSEVYTPTTKDVRHHYVANRMDASPATPEELGVEFDRWLEQRERGVRILELDWILRDIVDPWAKARIRGRIEMLESAE